MEYIKNVDKEKLDIDNDSDDDLNNSSDASVMICGTSVDPDQDGNVGFVDAIRVSKSRTACCLFVIIISVVLSVCEHWIELRSLNRALAQAEKL